MYRREHRHQLSFEDFFLPFGGKLSCDNRWSKLAELIRCDELEDDYSAQFCKGFGVPAKPFRMALGALSGDSENWSGGDTKTGPPRGASQAGRQAQRRGAISGADGCGDRGADPSGCGGDAGAIRSRLGAVTFRKGVTPGLPFRQLASTVAALLQ